MNPLKMPELLSGVHNIMQNLHVQKKKTLEDELNDEQKINLGHLMSIFEGKYTKEELVKCIIEHPDMQLGEIIDLLCN